MKDNERHMETNDPLKRLLRETALEQAPENLIPDVMKAIETPSPATVAAKPLISRRGWTVLAVVFLSLCALALLLAMDKGPLTDPLVPAGWIEGIQGSVPQLPAISQTARTAALAFGIFALVHLFWMKRQLSRQGLL